MFKFDMSTMSCVIQLAKRAQAKGEQHVKTGLHGCLLKIIYHGS